MTRPVVEERRFRGAPAVVLAAGRIEATFLPDLGMTGCLPALRRRRAPCAARRSAGAACWPHARSAAAGAVGQSSRVAPLPPAGGVAVDLSGMQLGTDGNGLPIHGLLVGQPGWRVEARTATRERASVRASIDVDAPAFPFPHRIEVVAAVHDRQLTVDTTLVPTGRRRVPVAFGWHPYLRLPGVPRARWRLHLPARTHLELDPCWAANGWSAAESVGGRSDRSAHVRRPLRARTRSHAAGDGGRWHVDQRPRRSRHIPMRQVWVPAGRPFVALEPMAAPTNSLVEGTAQLIDLARPSPPGSPSPSAAMSEVSMPFEPWLALLTKRPHRLGDVGGDEVDQPVPGPPRRAPAPA